MNTSPLKTRILLVDDQAMVRKAIRFVLKNRNDWEVIGEAQNGNAAINFVQQFQPDVVIMDVHLPDCTGIEVTEKIMQLFSSVKVIILTGDDDEYFLEEGLHMGISGYLFKGCAGEDLEKAVDAVMNGNVFIDSHFQNKFTLSKIIHHQNN